jgi:hypothetical protein
MNTGNRNTKGRAILRGPKGGLYVVGPSGAKIRSFTKAATPAAPPPRVATPPRAANTITHKGSTYTKTNVSVSGLNVYRKVGAKTYYTISPDGKPVYLSVGALLTKSNGSSVLLRNYKKTNGTRVATPPVAGPSVLNLAKAHMNTLPTAVARRAYLRSRASNMSGPNWTELGRHRVSLDHRASAARAARRAGGSNAPAPAPAVRRTTSATPRITTAERNARLAAIRARLNALRAARAAAMPKKRNNVDKRLKNAVARVRVRLGAARSFNVGGRPTRSTLIVPFCHAPATVPRKPCRIRKANVPVYTSPLIDDGTVVATRASDIDIDWFKRQDKYVKNLSDDDFWTAQAHTNRSHSWIGPFLYQGSMPRSFPGTSGKHIAPLWPQIRRLILSGTFKRRSGAEGWRDAWIETFKNTTSESDRYTMFCNNLNSLPSNMKLAALRMYQIDLKRIIAAAPKSRKKMVLYRGSYFDIFKDRPGHWLTLNSFCSAAYNLDHSLGYGNTLQRITVLPGSPVLLVAGMNQWDVNGEFEIMVNIGTKYLIRKRDVRRAGWTGITRILHVTDVTITK